MNELETALKVWRQQAFKALSLDDILEHLDITHLEFRKFLRQQGEELYPATPGLKQEILYDDIPYQRAKSKYYLTQSDAYKVFYQNHLSNKVAQDQEVLTLVKQGLGSTDIAQQLGLSIQRVSQIKKDHNLSSKYTRLTPSQREELKEYCKTHSVKQAVKKFKVSQPTIYRILACKST